MKKPKKYRNFSGVLALTLVLCSSVAQASDWGCQVLLCLASPGGPTQFAECVPPISKLWKELTKIPPSPFPDCGMEDGNDGTSYAKQIVDAYDPCPPGMSTVPVGSIIVEGKKKVGQAPWEAQQPYGYDVSSPEATSQPNTDNAYDKGPLACVGTMTGAYQVTNTLDDSQNYTVTVYDKIIWQQSQSPNAIDVYIDGTLNNRIHW
jgi:hypothetical protein